MPPSHPRKDIPPRQDLKIRKIMVDPQDLSDTSSVSSLDSFDDSSFSFDRFQGSAHIERADSMPKDPRQRTRRMSAPHILALSEREGPKTRRNSLFDCLPVGETRWEADSLASIHARSLTLSIRSSDEASNSNGTLDGLQKSVETLYRRSRTPIDVDILQFPKRPGTEETDSDDALPSPRRHRASKHVAEEA